MSSRILKSKYIAEKKFDCFFTQKDIQITKDGKYIFCHCSNYVTIVELETGSVVEKVESEEEEVKSLALSPDNASFVLGFSSSSVKHYQFKDDPEVSVHLLTSFRSYHHGPVLNMCWDSSSVLLATGSSDSTVRVWDLKQKYCTHSLKDPLGVIRVLMFDKALHQRPWLFGAADGTIFIWALEAGSSKRVAKLEGHDSPVTGLVLSQSRDQLISSGLDKVIILWDLETFSSKKIIPVFESLSGILLKPQDIDFYGVPQKSVEQNVVFTIGSKGIPMIWDADRGKEIWKDSGPIVPSIDEDIMLINHLYFVEAHNSIALTTYDNNILFIRCDSMKIWKQLVGNNDEILDVIFLGENETHTAVASNNSQIRVYDNSNQNCQLLTGHTSTVLALSNHPVDKTIFGSSSHDNTARIWKFSQENGSAYCLVVATGHTHSVGSLTFGADFLVTGSMDTCIKKWSFSMKKLLKQENKVFTAVTQKAHEKDINYVSLSKNFNLIASSSQDKTAKIWDGKTLELLGTLRGHRKGIWCVQFSPTDCLVATSSGDGTIKLWTLNDYSNIATFEGHEISVLRVAWVSNGLQLVSAASDGLVKLWTLKNNLCVNTFDEHEGRVWALTAAEDGAKLVSGGADSTLIWWKDVTQEEKEKEQAEANRLIEEEQVLMNLLQKKRWSKALRLSIRLNQPYRTLTTLKSLLDESPMELFPVLRKLKKDELSNLIEFVVQWNTKTRNARESQSVINYLLKELLPEDLEKLSNWQTLLEGLIPYTERHLKRVSALHQSTLIINYMVSTMSLGVDDEMKTVIDEDSELSLLQSIPKSKVDDEVKMETEADNKSAKEEEEQEETEGSDSESEDADELPERLVEDIKDDFIYEEVISESEDESNNDESE